jgi:hypothetical protein
MPEESTAGTPEEPAVPPPARKLSRSLLIAVGAGIAAAALIAGIVVAVLPSGAPRKYTSMPGKSPAMSSPTSAARSPPAITSTAPTDPRYTRPADACKLVSPAALAKYVPGATQTPVTGPSPSPLPEMSRMGNCGWGAPDGISLFVAYTMDSPGAQQDYEFQVRADDQDSVVAGAHTRIDQTQQLADVGDAATVIFENRDHPLDRQLRNQPHGEPGDLVGQRRDRSRAHLRKPDCQRGTATTAAIPGRATRHRPATRPDDPGRHAALDLSTDISCQWSARQ